MECRHVYQQGPKRGQTCGQQCRGEFCWKHKPANIERRKEYYRDKYRTVPKCTIEVLRTNCHREIADKLAKADKLAVDRALGPRRLGPNSIAEAAHDEIDRCNKKPMMLWVMSTYGYLLDQEIDRITLEREIAMMSFRKLREYAKHQINELQKNIVVYDHEKWIFNKYCSELDEALYKYNIHQIMLQFAYDMDKYANILIDHHDRELNIVMQVWKGILEKMRPEFDDMDDVYEGPEFDEIIDV